MEHQPKDAEAETDLVRAVYELREAAVAHGVALAHADGAEGRSARDELLSTQTELEEKTAAAIDDCAANAKRAVEEAN